MSSIGRVNVKVGMDSSEFRSGAGRMRGEFKGISSSISESAGVLRKWQRDAVKIFEETRTPMERYQAEVAKLRAVFAQVPMDAETQRRALAKLDQQYAELIHGSDKLSEEQKEAQRIFEQMRTPLERYNAELARLKTLQSHLDPKTYRRAVGAARARYDDESGASKLREDARRAAAAEQAAAQRAAEARRREMQAEARRIFEQTRTPAERYSAELARLSRLHRAGWIDANTFGRAVAGLNRNFSGLHQALGAASPLLAQMPGGFVAMAASAGPAAAAIAVLSAAILGGGASLRFVVRESEAFNTAMRSSTAIQPGLSRETKGRMRQQAFSVGFDNPAFRTDQYAQSYRSLASAGLSAEQQIAALPVVANFATAGMFDLDRATTLLTDAQAALGLSSKDAGENMRSMTRVSDVLVKAEVLANASVEQFSTSLTNKAGASMKMLGMEIEEGVAVLGAYANQGIKAEEAGTMFAIALRDLQNAARENKATFQEMKIDVFDTSGEVRFFGDIVADLEKALSGMSDEQRRATLVMLGFQDRSVHAIQALLGTSGSIREFYRELQKAGGISKQVADEQMTPMARSLGMAKAAASEMADSLGTDAIAAFAEIVQTAAYGLREMTDAYQGLKELTGGRPLTPFGATLSGLSAVFRWVNENQPLRPRIDAKAASAGAATGAQAMAKAAAADPEIVSAMVAARAEIVDLQKEIEQFGMSPVEKRIDDFARKLREAGGDGAKLSDSYGSMVRQLERMRAEQEKISQLEKERQQTIATMEASVASWTAELQGFGLSERQKALQAAQTEAEKARAALESAPAFGDKWMEAFRTLEAFRSMQSLDKSLGDQEQIASDERAAQAINQQFRSPLEVFGAQRDELLRLTEGGLVEASAAQAAMQSYLGTLGQGYRSELPTAMIRGSQAEYNARIDSEQKDPLEKIKETALKQLLEALKQGTTLREIKTNLDAIKVGTAK